MITLPPGFDVALYFSELFGVAAPFVGIAALVASAVVIRRSLRR